MKAMSTALSVETDNNASMHMIVAAQMLQERLACCNDVSPTSIMLQHHGSAGITAVLALNVGVLTMQHSEHWCCDLLHGMMFSTTCESV